MEEQFYAFRESTIGTNNSEIWVLSNPAKSGVRGHIERLLVHADQTQSINWTAGTGPGGETTIPSFNRNPQGRSAKIDIGFVTSASIFEATVKVEGNVLEDIPLDLFLNPGFIYLFRFKDLGESIAATWARLFEWSEVPA